MKLTFKQVTPALYEYKKIKQLYLTAFPADERAPFPLLMMKSYRKNADFYGIYIDGLWVGMVYVVSRGDVSYIFYLAIAKEHRGKGFGSTLIKALLRRYEGQRLFLALEQLDESAPNYEERLRRRHFYEKNGLHDLHCHIREGNVVFDTMGTAPIAPEEYNALMREYLGFFLRGLAGMESCQ